MTRDWLLTLVVLFSPYLLAATGAIVILAVTRRPAHRDRVRRTVEEGPRRSRSDGGSDRDAVCDELHLPCARRR